MDLKHRQGRQKHRPATPPAAQPWLWTSALIVVLSAITAQAAQEPLRLQGNFAQTFRDPDGRHVVVLRDEVRLRHGQQTAQADQAVVWLQRLPSDSPSFSAQIVLQGRPKRKGKNWNARKRDGALLLSLDTVGEILLSVDTHVNQDGQGLPLYQTALALIRPDDQPPEPTQTPVPPPAETITTAPQPQPPVIVDTAPQPFQPPAPPPAAPDTRPQPRQLTKPPGNTVHIAPQGRFESRRLPDGSDVLLCLGGIYIYRNVSPDELTEQDSLADAVKEEALLELRAETAVVFYWQDKIIEGVRSLRKLARGVYLQGDVVFQLGEHSITAEELYYDFHEDRALIVDAVMRSQIPDHNVPVHLRAQRMRQLSLNHFYAQNLKLSTDEFHEPGVWVGAEQAEIVIDRNEEQDRLHYDLHNLTANVGPAPLMWLPRAQGSSARASTPLKRVRGGYQGDYGTAIETEWSPSWLLGLAQPEGVSSTLKLDEYTKRGPGGGLDVEYNQQKFFGSLRSYLVYDDGEDSLGDYAPRDDVEPPHKTRGRVRWQHRHYLPQSWQGTFEVSYANDPYFVEAWEEKEFDTDKDQETMVYFKQQRDNWAFDFLSKFHLNDFEYTQTELPSVGLHVAGLDLFDLFTYHHDGAIRRIRERAGDRDVPGFFEQTQPWLLPDLLDQDDFAFITSRHELSLPINMGTWRFAPTLIGTYVYDDRNEDNSFVQGAAGFRTSTQFWHIDDSVRSRLWNLNRIRHIIIPEASVFWVDSDLSDIDHHDVYNFTVRQRWQTKRGPIGAQRSVDFLRWNVSTTLVQDDIDDAPLPNRFHYGSPEPQFGNQPIMNADLFNLNLAGREVINQTVSDFVTSDWAWRISETTALTGSVNANIHDGTLDQADLAVAVQRSPRTSYFVGHRFLRDVDRFDEHARDVRHDAHFLTTAVTYQLNPKYTLAVGNQFDIERTTDSFSQAVVVRKFNRWYGAFSVGFDASRDNLSFLVSFWPQGFEDLAIGSRRFTYLTE